MKKFRFDLALREGLEIAGMTQSDLARQMSVSRQAVSLWMQKRDARLSLIMRVCQKLQIPVDDFMEMGSAYTSDK